MDLGTVLGFTVMMVTVVVGTLTGGSNVMIYYNLPSILITFFGSFGALMMTAPLSRTLNIVGFFRLVLYTPRHDEEKMIAQLVAFSEKARREGLLALEDDLSETEDDFLRKGLQFVVDGTDPEIIKSVLFNELNKINERHGAVINFFDSWSKLAPAFGMLGTLLGLVAMLGRLADPGAIGAGMAVALLTTLYGVIITYMFLMPVMQKFSDRDLAETLNKEMLIEGVLSIQAGDNPRILEEKLVSYLPPSRRESVRQEANVG